MLTLEKFKQASAIVKEVTLPTKLVYSEYLSKQTGADVYLKPENMQYTGAYKVRGAYYKISTMSEEDRKKGLVTASAGNHAQGVALAATSMGIKSVVCLRDGAPLMKVESTKRLGAQVELVKGEGGAASAVEGLGVAAAHATGEKCERCWKYSATIGSHAAHPTLCARCASVVEA